MTRYVYIFLSAFIMVAVTQSDIQPAHAQTERTPPPQCVYNAGVLDASRFTAQDDFCVGEPDYYGITVYEIGLCTASPTVPTTSNAVDTSNCITVYRSAAGGQPLEVRNGETVSIASGTFTNPEIGVYTHAFVRLNNRIDIRNSVEFSTAMTTDEGSSGNFCWSKDVVINPDTPTTSPRAECGSSAPTASQIGTTTDVLGGFGSNETGDISFVSLPVLNGTLSAYLITADGSLPAAGEAITNILAIHDFTTPPEVTANTSFMDVAFRVSQGMGISVDNNDASRLGHFGSGPFALQFTIR